MNDLELSTFEQSRLGFLQKGYLVLQGLIEDPLVSVTNQYILNKARVSDNQSDTQVPNVPSFYGDTLSEVLLELVQPILERSLGLELYPTYSYCRIYQKGAELKRHRDRHACEISVTVPVGASSPEPWPIHLDHFEGEAVAELGIGDGLVYRACQFEHWREPLRTEYHTQVMLHYVEREGPYAEHKYDGRPGLFLTAVTKHVQFEHDLNDNGNG